VAMKILLADDSMTAQNMGKKILTDAGFEVIAVSNGAAALKKITAENPDIIILDVFMPGYTGLEVCERLKNNPETSRKPVLLTVGKMEPFNPDDSNRVHAEGVMIKPFEATDLTAAVEAIAKRFNIQKTAAPPPPPPTPKAPQSYRSYEETVMMSQDELRQSLGIADTDNGAKTTEAASMPAMASSSAVAVAAPALELGVDSSAIVTEQPEIKSVEAAVPAMELETPARPAESDSHSPFSHASVAREVVEHPVAPVPASETADWDPVLDGIAISSSVVSAEPEQPVAEAQPMFGLEYAVPASVAQETPAPSVKEIKEEAVSEQVVSSSVQSIQTEQPVTSPSAYLAEASAAMDLETSHAIVEEEPVVEAAPDFEPNVAPPVQVETHAENGIEPGIEQPSPELTVPPDPALVGGTESFSSFTTHFGVENAEVIPVGIVPELMQDASSSYEYQPPEEGHAFEGEGEAEAVGESKSAELKSAESKSDDVPPVSTSVSVNSTPDVSWDMVPVEAPTETSPTTAPVPDVAPAEAAPVHTEPAAVEAEAEPALALRAAEAPIEESTPAAEAPAVEAAEQPFDPDATQALPEEFFTSSEPQLETTAELVGASVSDAVVEQVADPQPEPLAAVAEEPPVEEHVVAPELEAAEPTVSVPEAVIEPQPTLEAHIERVESLPPPILSVATEPAILSVGPEPPSIAEEHPVETPRIEPHPSVGVPAIAAAAAAGASVLGAAITEHLQHVSQASAKPAEDETAPGDQTQVFIASAVARVLDRMKPTLIEEIAREMSNRRKPRKDPEE
jgi:CheY-like chemotaxis protein